MVIDNGGPAYPQAFADGKGWPHSYGLEGMSLRDYFASQAMGGFLSGLQEGPFLRDGIVLTFQEIQKHLSETAYQYADAMLEARKEQPNG